MNDTVGIGDNRPPPYEAITLRVEELLAGATRLEQNHPVVDSDELAEKIGGFKRQLQAALTECEKARKEEKEPYWRAGQEVDARWNAWRDKLQVALDMALAKLTRWGKVKEVRAAEEAAKAKKLQEEAEKKLLEAERLAIAERAKLEKGETSNVIEAQAAADAALVDAVRADEQLNQATKPVAFGKQTQVPGTRAVRMETVYSVEVTDLKQLAFFFRENPTVVDALTRLALTELKAGRFVPGAILHEERKAK